MLKAEILENEMHIIRQTEMLKADVWGGRGRGGWVGGCVRAEGRGGRRRSVCVCVCVCVFSGVVHLCWCFGCFRVAVFLVVASHLSNSKQTHMNNNLKQCSGTQLHKRLKIPKPFRHSQKPYLFNFALSFLGQTPVAGLCCVFGVVLTWRCDTPNAKAQIPKSKQRIRPVRARVGNNTKRFFF